MWNVTSLGGKEPELVLEVERYWLDLVGLPPCTTLALDPTSLIGAGDTSHWLSAAMLEFTPVDERVASLHLRAGWKPRLLHMHRTAVRSMQPSWRSWLGPCKGLQWGTLWSYWET